MSLNPRKRTCDVGWTSNPAPKAPRIAGPYASSLAYAHASRPDIDSHSATLATNIQYASAILPVTQPNLASAVQHSANIRQTVPEHFPAGASQYHPAYKPTPISLASTHPYMPAVVPKPRTYKPCILHGPHPDSRIGQNFHWLPYPLGLLPYDSWYKLHYPPDVHPSLPFRCPVCRVERKVTPHMRKVFLVAERLAWDEGQMPVHDKYMNEQLNWAVNYDVGILDVFDENLDQHPGGKYSNRDKFYPYRNEHETMLALKLIFMTEDITEVTWALWIDTQLDMQKIFGHDEELKSKPRQKASNPSTEPRRPPKAEVQSVIYPKTPEIETIDLTMSPDRVPNAIVAKEKRVGLQVPSPSSSDKPGQKRKESFGANSLALPQTRTVPWKGLGTAPVAELPKPPCYPDHTKRITSYRTLQDFYSLLDRIEPTSFVGALFLEAYAEKLRDDMCRSCWFRHNVNLDLF